ncbi:nephrocystin-4 isoform X2 [Meleagris gallopavo]|uniref:nephrocystin-4 isoform X2 n=1 Tax=Meleagris gallopavo TaxID=9103 RepID=UPI000939FE81|nr:nephrocystin-4 isoform X2 [Meleagris gallopavo]
MAEWERLFAQSRAVPPHTQRRHGVPERSVPFQCVLKCLEGSVVTQQSPAELQLRLSLFDAAHRHFFGHTWHSSTRTPRSPPGQPPRVLFNEAVYFHTSLSHPSITAVVEVVAVAPTPEGISRDVSCGFGLIPLFDSRREPSDLAARGRVLKLYHGTPRALLHPLLQDPLEKNKYMTMMENSHLQYTLKLHPPLEKVFHLLPENLLVSGLQKIPGLLPAHGDTGDIFLKPRLMGTVPCYLDQLCVLLHPSLEEFEEELLEQLHSDRLLKEVGSALCVQERRLRVGVHNGLRFVQAPQVAVLQPAAEAARRQTTNPTDSAAEQALLLRSRLQLSEMVAHPAFGVCFQLEYVVCAAAKAAAGSVLGPAAAMHTVRWALWSPFLGATSSPVLLPLRGGAHPSPGQTLVYRNPADSESSQQVKRIASGSVQFHVSTDAEHRVTSTDISSKAGKEPEEPPTPSLSLRSPPRPAASTQGPGLSLSQLLASPQSRDERAVPRSRSAPKPRPCSTQKDGGTQHTAGITHLEADLWSGSPRVDASSSEHLRALPFVPAQLPVTAVGPPAGSAALSRASLALLHTSGFPEILDDNKEPVEVTEPLNPAHFSPRLEEVDALQSNEIILQFLAFSRAPQDALEGMWPSTVFLTFQFYRFPPVTTPRLQLLDADGERAVGSAVPAQVLLQLNKDGTPNTEAPGLQLRYVVDPSFLRPGEQRVFVRYLAEHSLQMDVWDGDSLLLVGSAAVKLKPLLRQGRPAVRTLHELEVVTTEYEQDAPPAAGRDVLCPLGARVAVRGRLHLCLANVGHRCEETPVSPRHPLLSHTHVVSSPGGGCLLSLHASGNVRVSRARRLAEVDSELAAILCSHRLEKSPEPLHAPHEAAAIQQHKMQRLAALQQQEDADWRTPQRMGCCEQCMQYLQIIDAYRERTKHRYISQMLSQAITITHTVYAMLGTAEFFEFALKNPYSVQHTVTVEVDHPELSVILDPREWRHFKELTQTATPLEEDMFHLRDDLRPQIYLRPKETVHIPFRFQMFSAEPAVAAVLGPVGLSKEEDAGRMQEEPRAAQMRLIQVAFRVSGGKPIALLQVKVEPRPHVVDQTFRFFHPELTFLKKAFRLPPWHTLPGAPVRMPGGDPEVYVRCSDPNVICETKNMGPGEPQDVFLKVAGGPSPQIKTFFVAIYTDPWLATPLHIWQFYLHSLQRLDVSCTAGQLSRLAVPLRGTRTLRRVKAFCSHPHELKVDPAGVFTLPPNGVLDLFVGVRPRRAGSRFFYLNLVDVECHQLVSSWLLCVTCRQPLISKAFEITIPAGSGKGSNKRITYTNPYPTRRLYFLVTSRPDLLQFKEDSFQVAGGEVYTIGLRFAPSQSVGEEEILIHINDHQDKNEETFCVKVIYY